MGGWEGGREAMGVGGCEGGRIKSSSGGLRQLQCTKLLESMASIIYNAHMATICILTLY